MFRASIEQNMPYLACECSLRARVDPTASGARERPAPMPTALDDPAFLARLRAEAKATAARIAAATRARALKAAEERRVSESGGSVVKEKS